MKKLILILLWPWFASGQDFLSAGALAIFAPRVSYKSTILLEPSAAHLYLFDNPSGAIKDYIGSDNPSIPSGLTMSQTGLLVNQTNTAALSDGTARISMTQSNTGNYTYTSNFTHEFIIYPNCPRTGTGTQYVFWSKPNASFYYGFTLLLQYNDIGAGGIGQANTMSPQSYIESDLLTVPTAKYRVVANCDITNGASYLIDFVYSYTNSTPLMMFYVNGNLIEAFETNTVVGSLGDFSSTKTGTIANFNTDSGSAGFVGVIQAHAIFNTNLSYPQILNHYLAFQGQQYSPTHYNYTQMRDINPNPALAIQGMTPFKTPTGYYVFGGLKTNDYQIPSGPNTGDWDNPITKVAVFSSPSLLPGTFTAAGNAGIAFDASAFTGTVTSITRASVISNSVTGTNVMLGHFGSNFYASGYTFIAASKTPDGPYALITQGSLMNGNQTADQSTFCEGANGYLVYDVQGNTSIKVTQLDANFFASSGSATTISTGQSVEAPVLFKATNYFMICSPTEFYQSTGCTDVYYSECSTLTGTWSALTSVFKTGENPFLSGYSFQSCSAVSNYDGAGNFLLLGDYWYHTNQLRSSTVAFKITFDSATTLHVTPSKSFRLQ